MLIPAGMALLTSLATQALFGSPTAERYEEMLVAIAILLSIPIVWLTGSRINSAKHTRILIDQQTGQEVVFGPRHSLFFIPMQYWALIFLVWELYFWVSWFSGAT
jgi:hypothetical protein